MSTIAKMGGRDALRAATHEVHERLHGHPLLASLADGTIGQAEYIWLLGRWLGFHNAVEIALATAPLPSGFDLAGRSKLSALRADLHHFGFDDAAIDALPLCPAIPAFDSPAAALGGAYVVEGSTMGGRVLAKALDPMLGEGDAGRRFLLGYGARHGAMWRSFLVSIEGVAASSPACHSMTGAANDTFAAFEAWLT